MSIFITRNVMRQKLLRTYTSNNTAFFRHSSGGVGVGAGLDVDVDVDRCRHHRHLPPQVFREQHLARIIITPILRRFLHTPSSNDGKSAPPTTSPLPINDKKVTEKEEKKEEEKTTSTIATTNTNTNTSNAIDSDDTSKNKNEPTKNDEEGKKKKMKLMDYFKEMGMPFICWWTGVWTATGIGIYLGMEYGGIDAQSILMDIPYVNDAIGESLSAVNPKTGNLMVAIGVNECLEPVRFPFVLVTAKPVIKAWKQFRAKE